MRFRFRRIRTALSWRSSRQDLRGAVYARRTRLHRFRSRRRF
jgi:hypothetical protein